MKKLAQNFIIDRLTDSILNTISGDSFQTEVQTLKDIDLLAIEKNKNWQFDWKSEYEDLSKEVFKLSILNNSPIIQGLISLSVEDGFVFVNLLESAPFNIGKNKLYEGVAGNLIAYACKLSFQRGYDGYVSFIAKTKLIKHYQESLGAKHFKNNKMIIDSAAAEFLVKKYFKVV